MKEAEKTTTTYDFTSPVSARTKIVILWQPSDVDIFLEVMKKKYVRRFFLLEWTSTSELVQPISVRKLKTLRKLFNLRSYIPTFFHRRETKRRHTHSDFYFFNKNFGAIPYQRKKHKAKEPGRAVLPKKLRKWRKNTQKAYGHITQSNKKKEPCRAVPKKLRKWRHTHTKDFYQQKNKHSANGARG